MIDKNPFTISDFKGINRGSNDDYFPIKTQEQVAFSEALDAHNLDFTKEGGIRTRPAFVTREPTITFGFGDVIHQHWKLPRFGTTYFSNRWMYLIYNAGSGDGMFYDTANPLGVGTPIATISGCKYASVLSIYGRVYISPLSDLGVPLTAESIYLYDGQGVMRVAGGTRPTAGSLAVANQVVSGANVTAGLHLCAVAFETDSGFITPPIISSTWLQVTAPGGQAVRFTNVPTGPAGTVARHLLITKSITNYDGIPENWEMFFGLRIGNNSATSGDIVVPDTGLVDSADYLLDEFETIPSCATITNYRSRLMYNGPRTDSRLIYVSKPSDPESIDQTEDYIQINDGLPVDIFTGRELRGLYYIFKETTTFVAREDINSAPNEWQVDLVDSGLGCGPFGIAEVMVNPGALVLDNLIVCGMAGIYLFTGAYNHVPLSRKIQALFNKELTRAQIKYVRMAVDPIKRRLYVLFGSPEDPTNELYVGNYFNGLSADAIKWSRWTFWVEEILGS